jgi:hypothetical protein
MFPTDFWQKQLMGNKTNLSTIMVEKSTSTCKHQPQHRPHLSQKMEYKIYHRTKRKCKARKLLENTGEILHGLVFIDDYIRTTNHNAWKKKTDV